MKGVGVESTDLGGEPLSLRSDAWALRARVKRPCLAWKTGPLRNILGATSTSAFPAPWWPVLPTAASSASEADDKSWSDVTPQPLRAARASKWLKSAVHSSSWVDVLDHNRSAALERWKVLVLSSGDATALGKAILQAQRAEDASAVDASISDAFRRKATSTLRTRAASLLMFCRWRATECGVASTGILPLDEKTVYDYVVHLTRRVGAGYNSIEHNNWLQRHLQLDRQHRLCRLSIDNMRPLSSHSYVELGHLG